MPTEETLVLVKPDGVARGLTGAILARIEAKGYSLVDIKLVEPDRDVLERHYAEHAGKPFYEPLVEFMLSGPSVAIRLAGNRVIEGFRSLAGTTDPTTAAPGTIRGDFGTEMMKNVVHASDSDENAKIELARFFKPEEPVRALVAEEDGALLQAAIRPRGRRGDRIVHREIDGVADDLRIILVLLRIGEQPLRRGAGLRQI